jgi:hypothetical protein
MSELATAAPEQGDSHRAEKGYELMQNPNQRLLQILAVGWLTFLGAGFALRQTLRGPTVTIIIDRSYCEPARWGQVTSDHARLYEQHEQQRLTIDQVIYVSDLGENITEAIPTPEEVENLSTFGRFNAEQLQQATDNHPAATVFACNP